MRFLHTKPKELPRLGLSESDSHYCLVGWREGEEVKCWQEEKNGRSVAEFLQQAVGYTPKTAKYYHLIRAVPYRFVWRKSCVLNVEFSPLAIYRQVVEILRQELPVPLEEVRFDYHYRATEDPHLWKVRIYALRRSYGDMLRFDEKTVLDCDLDCQLRARTMLGLEEGDGFVFDEQWAHYDGDLVQLEKATEQQLAEEEFFYDLPVNVNDITLYLTAFGAALWQGEFVE